jgi:hypothetical protein
MLDNLSPALRFTLVALAAWRLTHLLVEEDGPAEVVVRLRAFLGDGVAGRAMDCFYCLSMWVAAPLALAIGRDPVAWLVACLALSGAACLLERATAGASMARVPHQGVPDGLLRTTTSGNARDVRTAAGAAPDGGDGAECGSAALRG